MRRREGAGRIQSRHAELMFQLLERALQHIQLLLHRILRLSTFGFACFSAGNPVARGIESSFFEHGEIALETSLTMSVPMTPTW